MSKEQIAVVTFISIYFLSIIVNIMFLNFGYDRGCKNSMKNRRDEIGYLILVPPFNTILAISLLAISDYTLDRKHLGNCLINITYFLPVIAILSLWLL